MMVKYSRPDSTLGFSRAIVHILSTKGHSGRRGWWLEGAIAENSKG
jgi:hypothetical protein